MSRAPATVADAWDDYAQLLPIDTPEAQVTRLRRAYFDAMLTAARMVDAGVKPEQIRAECIGFASTIGRPIERATTTRTA